MTGVWFAQSPDADESEEWRYLCSRRSGQFARDFPVDDPAREFTLREGQKGKGGAECPINATQARPWLRSSMRPIGIMTGLRSGRCHVAAF